VRKQPKSEIRKAREANQAAEAKEDEWLEYLALAEKHLFVDTEDYRTLAEWARGWQAHRRGEKGHTFEARMYNERRDKAAMDNDHAFFRRLSRAHKALKDSPETLAEKKLSLAGHVIETAERLYGQSKKLTSGMIRNKLELDRKTRISDRQWQRLEPLAKKMASYFNAK
jgi:hypothetical protein